MREGEREGRRERERKEGEGEAGRESYFLVLSYLLGHLPACLSTDYELVHCSHMLWIVICIH